MTLDGYVVVLHVVLSGPAADHIAKFCARWWRRWKQKLLLVARVVC